jgi:hypothetical protein
MSYEFKSFFENLVLLEGVKVFQHEEEPNTWVFLRFPILNGAYYCHGRGNWR